MAEKILELEKEMARPDFWRDKEKAQEIVREYQELKGKAKIQRLKHCERSPRRWMFQLMS